MNAIEIKHLTKNYSGFSLENLNLTLPRGCIMGLVGENGAGKSTTIRMILGLTRPDSGEITVFGKKMDQALKQDEALPSIRGLAKDLRISVITTKRAYEELERAGFIYTVPGKGSFVAAKNRELLREEHLKKIEEYMTAIADLARGAGVSREEVRQMWDLIWEETK